MAGATKRLECKNPQYPKGLGFWRGRKAEERQPNFSFASHCEGRSYEQQSIGRSGIGSDDSTFTLIQRTPHSDPRFVEHMGVNHRRGDI